MKSFIASTSQWDPSGIKDNEKKGKMSLWSHDLHNFLYKTIYCFGFALLGITVYLEDPCILAKLLKNVMCVSSF